VILISGGHVGMIFVSGEGGRISMLGEVDVWVIPRYDLARGFSDAFLAHNHIIEDRWR